MAVRIARRVPWYHELSEQCSFLTVKAGQCKFSASYEVSGQDLMASKPACKVHSDIAVADGYKTKKIKPRKVDLDRAEVRSVPAPRFQSA